MTFPHRWTCVTMGVAIMTLMAGCGDGNAGSSAGADEQDAARDFETAATEGDQQAGLEAMRRMNEAGKEEVTIESLANAHRLQTFFPEQAGGWQRVATDVSEPNPRSPMLASSAEATYAPEGGTAWSGPRVKVEIMDMGSMRGMANMIRSGIDHQDGATHIKSVEFQGHLTLQEIDTAAERAELQVKLPGRLLLTATGEQADIEQVKQVAGAIDLKALVEQSERGGLSQPTTEERTPLVDAESLQAVLPEQPLEGYESQRIFANQLPDSEPPHTQAQASYMADRYLARITIRAYKSERHAQQGSPQTVAAVAAGLGDQLDQDEVTRTEWNGHPTLIVPALSQGVQSQTHVGPFVIQVQAQDREQLRALFDAIELDALQALTPQPTEAR